MKAKHYLDYVPSQDQHDAVRNRVSISWKSIYYYKHHTRGVGNIFIQKCSIDYFKVKSLTKQAKQHTLAAIPMGLTISKSNMCARWCDNSSVSTILPFILVSFMEKVKLCNTFYHMTSRLGVKLRHAIQSVNH